jgi:hypothetical protein
MRKKLTITLDETIYDGLLRVIGRLQVVPLTSNVGRLYPSKALVTLQGQQSKAMAAASIWACATRGISCKVSFGIERLRATW